MAKGQLGRWGGIALLVFGVAVVAIALVWNIA